MHLWAFSYPSKLDYFSNLGDRMSSDVRRGCQSSGGQESADAGGEGIGNVTNCFCHESNSCDSFFMTSLKYLLTEGALFRKQKLKP